MNERISDFTRALEVSAADYSVMLDAEACARLENYCSIIERFNSRLHLFAPVAPAEFATRHILESCFAAQFIPDAAHILDIGSGGGAPAIPLLITRPDTRAMLIEATTKKAIFLREALRETGSQTQAEVVNQRFETMPTPAVAAPVVVTCRALERFGEMLARIVAWSPDASRFVLFGGEAVRVALEKIEARKRVVVPQAVLIPRSDNRFVFVAEKTTA
ncbi:MAG: class I SAM-dependent methyltransferase [Pyrinomonadaceae bacterium MAG19_C2-C3]|nr:class I SAM-dependent methyltransferase [Pyrinomonadaceae bacterium MAG19_C2-C3]